jgi:hypothetical protein
MESKKCKEDCECIERGFCDKFCNCDPDLCTIRRKGCNCKQGCKTLACNCFFRNLECDPDVLF